MGLFSPAQIAQVNAIAEKSRTSLEKVPTSKSNKSINSELNRISQEVIEYFKDSKSILITTKEDLHEYVLKCIESGYAGIDTETTGLDRIKDTIVGASLYYPGGLECYIPIKHLVPIFDVPYNNQLTYEEVQDEFQILANSDIKLIFANADFDLAMIYKDLHVDFIKNCYFDVILAWRCLKENEKSNQLKILYNKYVLKGVGDPKKFSDFFSPALFPYCKPEVAKLYAANDAKITYELFKWELPFLMKDHPKCKKNKLEAIADLVWGVEFPLIGVCQKMHRQGIYLEKSVADMLNRKYVPVAEQELAKLRGMVQVILDDPKYSSKVKRPFSSGADFNPDSTTHVAYLCYDLMKLDSGKAGRSTGKEVLGTFNHPVMKQILKCRSYKVLISTFVEKLPNAVAPDNRIHCRFNSIGADTGRMCIAEGTKITVLNGYKNIEDIVPGDLVYCYDMSGQLHLAPVKNLWLTGTDRDCVRVRWQSTGRGDVGELICTPEHKILTKAGQWVNASNLKRYQKVAHMRRTLGSAPDFRPAIYGWNNLATREQDIVKSSIFHASSDMVIHHKDENPSNNNLSNLEIMSVSDHSSYHSDKSASCGKIKYQHLLTPASQKKAHEVEHNKYVEKVISERDMLIQMIADANGRISKVNMDFDTFKRRCSIAGIDISKECQKYNPQYHKSKIPKEEFISVYEQFEGKPIRVTEHFGISYDKFYKYCKEYEISLNHSILSVKPCGKYNVYDIEVEGYHNFIANEICVHNSSADPNMQNIPSKASDIRHMFRATPGYVLLSSDYSQQEPKLTAYVSQDEKMIQAFKDKKDIYAIIASIAFGVPYEDCLEFHPETHAYQPEGKARRGEAKTIVLGRPIRFQQSAA